MELNKILSDWRWGIASTHLNLNFEKIRIALMRLLHSSIYIYCKGYFSGESRLLKKYPNPQEGWYAFVGTPWPGKVYECGTAGTWIDTGTSPAIGDGVFVELLKRYVDGTTIYWDETKQVIHARGGGSAGTFTITVNVSAADIDRCTVNATGAVVSITESSDGSNYTILANAVGTVKVIIVPESGYQVQSLTVDDINKGEVCEYTFENLSDNHTMAVTMKVSEEVPAEFLVRSDLPGYHYSSMQDTLNAIKATYPEGLTQDVTITCVKPAKEKRRSDHYLAMLSDWNQRTMYSLTLDGKDKLYFCGNSLGCLSFANVDNIIIRNVHFEDFSNYVGHQIPDAVSAISFIGKVSKYARNLFVGNCTFDGKSMTNAEIMSTNSVILIDTENVTINGSSFINGCGPVVNVDTCSLLSVLNNDFVAAPIGVGYPTLLTVSNGDMVIMEDNRMSGDNRYSFVSLNNVDRLHARRNTFKDGGSMALSLASSVPMSEVLLESNLFAGMLSNAGSINSWAQTVIGLCPIRKARLVNNTFYMAGNLDQQYATRWGTVTRLELINNILVDAHHAAKFIYGFAFDNVSEMVCDYNVYQYKLHNNIAYGSLIRVYNTDGVEGAVSIDADRACRFAAILALGYDTHSVLVSDGVDADALDENLMITSSLDSGNPAHNTNVPAIDLAYKSKSSSVNSRGCYNRHGATIDETIEISGYTGYNMATGDRFSDAAQYSSMAEDTLLLTSKTLTRNRMPAFCVKGSTDSFLIIGRYGLLAPMPVLDDKGDYVSDENYTITID